MKKFKVMVDCTVKATHVIQAADIDDAWDISEKMIKGQLTDFGTLVAIVDDVDVWEIEEVIPKKVASGE